MSTAKALSPIEFGALMEVSKGCDHAPINSENAVRLMRLGLISSAFGNYLITVEGKTRLAAGL